MKIVSKSVPERYLKKSSGKRVPKICRTAPWERPNSPKRGPGGLRSRPQGGSGEGPANSGGSGGRPVHSGGQRDPLSGSIQEVFRSNGVHLGLDIGSSIASVSGVFRRTSTRNSRKHDYRTCVHLRPAWDRFLRKLCPLLDPMSAGPGQAQTQLATPTQASAPAASTSKGAASTPASATCSGP